MGILGWLTGRDEKESDVYANFERVDEVVTSLKKVSTDTVTDAAEAVKAAVTELNQAKGMAEFVGQVNVDSFTPTFERVTSTIDQVATMIQQKADNIKVYEAPATKTATDEIGLKITARDFVLPCGCTTKWTI